MRIQSDEALANGIAALVALDGRWAEVRAIAGQPPLRWREAGFSGLAWVIVSQQLSVAAADSILKRLHARIAPFEPVAFLAEDEAALRGCGLSRPKIAALTTLAQAVASGALDLAKLDDLPADEARARLVALKGIGPWTADCYLLFAHGHPDAWPAADVALQEAARLAFDLPQRPDAKAMEPLAEGWRPWRGIAARLLWAYYRVMKQREGVTG